MLRKTVLSLKHPTGVFVASQTRTCRGEAPPSCLRKTVLSLKSPTGAFIAPLRCANANLSGRGPSILLRKTVLSLKSPTGVFVASQTRTFESASFSAACKKKQGKLWQNERGPDGASPLDKATTAKKFRTHLHPGFVPVCRMPLQSERSRAIMPL